jgi:hypothetical protein
VQARDFGRSRCGYNLLAVSSALRARIKHFLQRFIVISLASLLALTVLAYAVDYVVFRYRVATNRQPFSQITVSSYDAVKQKNGKTEFIFNPPEAQTCANALFARGGYIPCWYLRRHTEPRTDI